MARFRAGEARDERRSDFGERRSQRDETSAAAAVQRAAVLPLESTAPPASGAPQRLAQRALRPKTLPSARGAQPAEADPSPEPSRPKRSDSRRSVQSPPGLKTAASNRHPTELTAFVRQTAG